MQDGRTRESIAYSAPFALSASSSHGRAVRLENPTAMEVATPLSELKDRTLIFPLRNGEVARVVTRIERSGNTLLRLMTIRIDGKLEASLATRFIIREDVALVIEHEAVRSKASGGLDRYVVRVSGHEVLSQSSSVALAATAMADEVEWMEGTDADGIPCFWRFIGTMVIVAAVPVSCATVAACAGGGAAAVFAVEDFEERCVRREN